MNIKQFWIKFHDKYLQQIKLRIAKYIHTLRPGRYCWADCVSYALGPYRINPFKIESAKGCETESKEHSAGGCYCGAWKGGKCFDKLSDEEKINYLN